MITLSRLNKVALSWLSLVIFILVQLGVAQASVKTFDSFQVAQQYQFIYHVTVPKQSPGKKIALWVPYPAEDEYQQIIDYSVESPVPWKLTKGNKFGNRMIYSEWVSTGKAVDLVFTYKLKRLPSAGFHKRDDLKGTSLDPSLYKSADRWVPFTATIRKMAEEQVAGLNSPSQKIKAIYNHVVKIMSYNKDGTGWGKGDPVWACSTKRGNCTDFHSLYIALVRTQGIAARFKIGFPIPDQVNESSIAGYHCWAEVFDPALGWIPLDASEAKKSGLKDKYFGRIPSDRILFSVGRDLLLAPPQKGDRLNYFVYPYAEVGGQEMKQLKKEVSFLRLGIKPDVGLHPKT